MLLFFKMTRGDLKGEGNSKPPGEGFGAIRGKMRGIFAGLLSDGVVGEIATGSACRS